MLKSYNNCVTFAKNNAEVIFLNKKNKKKSKKDVIDLTSYISPEMVNSDVDGSYTGVTKETYYGDELETPVQDADDL
jgi:hypothetical protein